MSIKIKGIAQYQTIEGGFWSIISDDGKKLIPQNMPEQFKEHGAIIECRIDYLEDYVGFVMWGEYVRIVSFRTIGS